MEKIEVSRDFWYVLDTVLVPSFAFGLGFAVIGIMAALSGDPLDLPSAPRIGAVVAFVAGVGLLLSRLFLTSEPAEEESERDLSNG